MSEPALTVVTEGPAAPPAEAPAPAPPPVPESLTPYQRRKAREEERRRAAEERRARREARAATKASAPAPTVAAPAAPPAPTDPGIPVRSTEQRAKDTAVFLRGLFRVLHAVCVLFGYNLRPLDATEAKSDAAYWLPLAERYQWFDRLISWVGAPVALVERIAEHLEPRPVKGGKPTDGDAPKATA